MSDATASVMLPTKLADASALDRFRAAELQSIAAKSVSLDDMIERCLAESYDLCGQARSAERIYGTPFHPSIIRRCAELGKTAEFLGLVWPHREEVRAILIGGAAPARRRRA